MAALNEAQRALLDSLAKKHGIVQKGPDDVAPPAPAPAGALTPRELEVLALIAEGLSNPEIAAKLALSVETVKSHVRHLLAKMVVTSRVQAAIVAYRTGMLDV